MDTGTKRRPGETLHDQRRQLSAQRMVSAMAAAAIIAGRCAATSLALLCLASAPCVADNPAIQQNSDVTAEMRFRIEADSCRVEPAPLRDE
ncbi:MAG: hypothetical protein ACU837_15890 [Gammaproteobacteria bacterium]